jgi:hypothetical protein
MVASVNSVYQLVMRRSAKEENGFISHEDFNSYARSNQQKLFQSIYAEYRQFLANKQRYLTTWKGNYNSLEAIADDLLPLRRNRVALASSASNNIFQYPSDYAYFIDVEYNGKNVTLIDVADRSYYVNSYDAAPSAADAVAVKDYVSIELLPSTATSEVSLSYFKLPQGTTTTGAPSTSYPTWGYTAVSGKSVYNSSTSIDFELPAQLEYRLATMILQDVGIEIREAELFQMANVQEQKETQDIN